MKFKDIEKLVKILENSLVAEIEITDLLGRKIKISECLQKEAIADCFSSANTFQALVTNHETRPGFEKNRDFREASWMGPSQINTVQQYILPRTSQSHPKTGSVFS